MFDVTKQFKVPILSAGQKVCQVRFPTDTEWCERARKQRSVRRFLGRGKSEAEDLDTGGIDSDLLGRIRIDKDGTAFDDAEAGAVLAKLERATVTECERSGAGYRIKLRVAGAEVTHVLAMPTQRQMQEHERASVKVIGARRSQEIRGFLEPSGELYDAIAKSSDGYAGAIPIVHKTAAVAEVLQQLSADDEDVIPEA